MTEIQLYHVSPWPTGGLCDGCGKAKHAGELSIVRIHTRQHVFVRMDS